MHFFLRAVWWIIVAALSVGVLVLLAVVFYLPPHDPDSFNLVRERTARLAAYRLNRPMPGAVTNGAPLEQRLTQAGFKLGAPAFIRVYKLSFELEVWLKRDSQFALFATYPICYFSGQLGPKVRFGDWQSPEGFYKVEQRQLNPFSAHHRAFNVGFPNAYDRQHGYTGSLLEVHGGCSSIGCYAITNPAIDDVYRIISAAFNAGQTSIQLQALPFHMTADALAARTAHPQAPFWQELKTVADVFDDTHLPPDVAVCNGHYRVARRPGASAAPAESGCQKL